FGVQAKEKIKKIRGNIDILSLSATPIPRSLNMALSGLKQVSMLTTPPVGKQAIHTVVTDFSESVIFEAGKREFDRGGQIFFIHNRVQNIQAMQGFLEKLFPGKKVLVTHGQLPGDTLEKRIIAFKKKEYDILLSTTVIENGIDFRDVNTIFINDATNFGISQIHQLRGRVGRGSKKGYCYLLFKKDKIKEDAAKRLKTIVDYSHLGAGFELAVKDLEIRGGGDILGIRQSGSSSEVGLSLFLEMLENKIEELKNIKISKHTNTNNEKKEVYSKIDTKVDIQIEAYIDNIFFNGELDKLQFYREIETISDLQEVENMYEGFRDISREIPQAIQNFFNLLRLKIYAGMSKIESIKQVGINYQIEFVADAGTKIVEDFLKKDREVRFQVVTLTKLRSPKKYFTSPEKFIQYCLEIFTGKQKPKIKKKVKIKS
ncbi:hypothetical protein KGV52_01875, partial [Candidatus Gracilibacteria bacterium]|nr:hypothetical protein [Candidatus Gracilibacteria bacterium]